MAKLKIDNSKYRGLKVSVSIKVRMLKQKFMNNTIYRKNNLIGNGNPIADEMLYERIIVELNMLQFNFRWKDV